MLRTAFKVDDDGFIIEGRVVDIDDLGIPTETLEKNIITHVLPNGFYTPRWNGAKWIEGATQEEIEELTKPQPSLPTVEEQLAEKDEQILKLKEEQHTTQQMTIQNSETQQELIELLMDMGVI